MFREVTKEEAIMAALRGVPAFCMNVDMDPTKVDELVFRDIRQEFFVDLVLDTDSRFIIDDPQTKAERPTVAVPVYSAEELARCFEEAQNKKPMLFNTEPDQEAPKANQNEAKAEQSGPEADQEAPKANQKAKFGKAQKDIDIGKVQALHNAGWSIAKIADEMGVSASVIQRRLADVERTK